MGLTRRDLMLAAGVGTAGLVATSAGGAAAWSMAGPPESAADGPVLEAAMAVCE